MRTSECINELVTALSKAQGKIVGALKDSNNPFFKSKYADLASCWEACRDQLAANALAVIQGVETTEGNLCVTTRLAHCSGQWIESTIMMHPKDDSPQAAGSAITYARRYALAAIVGLAQVDDDGEAAQGRGNGNANIHSPKGDLGKSVPLGDARQQATLMRGLLEADFEEETKALRIADQHDLLNKNPDLYVASADQMSAKERAAWKGYVKMASEFYKRDTRALA